MLKEIYSKLKEENLNPYFIGQHEGLCKNPFVVVKKGTQISSVGTNKTGQRIIDIIVFVPLNSYVALDPYMKKVRLALKDLSYLRKTGLEIPAITDDEKKAYTTSIEYTLQKKLEG